MNLFKLKKFVLLFSISEYFFYLRTDTRKVDFKLSNESEMNFIREFLLFCNCQAKQNLNFYFIPRATFQKKSL